MGAPAYRIKRGPVAAPLDPVLSLCAVAAVRDDALNFIDRLFAALALGALRLVEEGRHDNTV